MTMTSVPPQTVRQSSSNRNNERKRSGHGTTRSSGRGERRVDVVGAGARSDDVMNRGGSRAGLGGAGQGKSSAELVKSVGASATLDDRS